MRDRLGWGSAVSVLAAALVACGSWPGPVAPEGARLRISASDDSILVGGEETTLRVTIETESGELLRYGAEVSMTATNGVLTDDAGRVQGAGYNTTADNGELAVRLRSERRAGAALIRVTSGTAKDSVTVWIVAAPPPDEPEP
ncbi:MAG: hypothetical protein ACKVZ0_17205 [Gemmatimonadales bacterium]